MPTPKEIIDFFYGPPPKPGEKKLQDLRKKVPKPERPKSEGVEISEARELLGKDVFGPEEVDRALGIEISPEQIPPLPYSREQLKKAKELGEMLVLRVDKDNDGQPLTMQKMQAMLQPQFTKNKKGVVLVSDWQLNEPFFTTQTPRLEWKLARKEIIKNSVNSNYVTQTKLLRDYLLPLGALTPSEEAECSDTALRAFAEELGVDWISQAVVDQKKRDANWETVATKLANLKINQNHRRQAVEALYDTLLAFGTNDERLLQNTYDWTNTRSADGRLVLFGRFGSGGAHVGRWPPGNADGNIGVVSSR